MCFVKSSFITVSFVQPLPPEMCFVKTLPSDRRFVKKKKTLSFSPFTTMSSIQSEINLAIVAIANLPLANAFNFHKYKFLLYDESLKPSFQTPIFTKMLTHKIRVHRYREFVYSTVVYKKYLTRLRELIIFGPWRENYHFSQPSILFIFQRQIC